MPAPRLLPPLLCLLLAATSVTGCGDDGATTTSASTVPPALAAQGDRGGTETGSAPAATPLKDYASGGRAASAPVARAVRAGFRGFARGVLDRDAAAACSHVTGFEALLRARGQQGDCQTLLPAIGNTSAGPSPRDIALISGADVVVAGDRATISVGSEAPVPMARVGGDWKLDYAAFAETTKDP
ncbi:hypothetical protein AB0L40_07595 [Patulibacter sp. NPDC049589]|uniref:hypothetical protein n=1 Tax=Patulibacter sp. NPDC049589 TaxID=3154731 RepID=UPI00342E2DCA